MMEDEIKVQKITQNQKDVKTTKPQASIPMTFEVFVFTTPKVGNEGNFFDGELSNGEME